MWNLFSSGRFTYRDRRWRGEHFPCGLILLTEIQLLIVRGEWIRKSFNRILKWLCGRYSGWNWAYPRNHCLLAAAASLGFFFGVGHQGFRESNHPHMQGSCYTPPSSTPSVQIPQLMEDSVISTVMKPLAGFPTCKQGQLFLLACMTCQARGTTTEIKPLRSVGVDRTTPNVPFSFNDTNVVADKKTSSVPFIFPGLLFFSYSDSNLLYVEKV